VRVPLERSSAWLAALGLTALPALVCFQDGAVTVRGLRQNTALEKRRIVSGGFGWEIAHGRDRFATPADFPRRGGTPYRGYAYDVGVRDVSIVQGPLSVAPCPTLTLRFATVASLYH
jgi:hypothetical protein